MVSMGRGCSLVGVFAVALAAGCGLDLADGGDVAADTDDGNHDTTGAGDTSAPEGTGTEDPSGLTGADSTDSGGAGPGDTDDADSGEPIPSACDALTCSGRGYCDDAADGPVCVCDEGWASVGLDCIECDTLVDAVLPASVPTVRANVEFQFDGALAPNSAYDYGRLSLRNHASGDIVPLGDTFSGTASVLMVPGTYDVLYQHREGTDLPKNTAAVIDQVTVDAANAQLTIDVTTATLRGTVGFATDDEPASPAYDYGRVWLVGRNGDRIRLADSFEGIYDVRVVPGHYEIHYELRESQGNAPLNRDGFLGEVDIEPGTNTEDITIDVAHVSGGILIDGAPVNDAYDNGDLELRDTRTGDRFLLAGTEDSAYAIPLLPGTYEVLYTSREVGDQTPINEGAVVKTLTVSKEDMPSEDIAMQTAVVSGSFSLQGGAIPTSNFDDGIVTLESPQWGTALLGVTSVGTYSARVLVGDYQAFYAQETAGVSMPVNLHGVLDAVGVQADTTRNLDIPVVEVVGSLTIDGAPAPDSPYDDGRLFLRNVETGDKVLLGNTREGTYAARVMPGTYDVIYENEFSDEFLPVNRGALVLEGVVIAAGGQPLDIDVPVSTLVGAVVIENATPSPAEGIGNLFLRDVASGDEVFIGHTGAAEFTKPLTDGTYVMEYRGVAASGATLGTSLPANANAAFACFTVVSG